MTPDYELSKKHDDYVNVPGQLGMSILGAFNTEPGSVLIIVQDLGAWRYTSYQFPPIKTASGAQTFTGKIHLASSDDAKKGFFLCFPPGKGTMNILSINLADPSKAAPAP